MDILIISLFFRKVENKLHLNNYTPYNTLQRSNCKSTKHERVSIKSRKRNFQPIFKSAKYFSHSIRSFGSPNASKRNSISTMDNNLTFHVSSRSRFATISSVQPKKNISPLHLYHSRFVK